MAFVSSRAQDVSVRSFFRLAFALALCGAVGCALVAGFGDDPRPRSRGGDDAGADASPDRGDAQLGRDALPDGAPAARYVYFRLEGYGGPVFRLKVERGASREDVGALLRANNPPAAAGFDAQSMYEFRHFTVSRDGARFAVASGRYSATGMEGFYVGSPGDWKLLAMACDEIRLPAQPTSPAGLGILTADGKRVVFEHDYDYLDGGARREGIWTSDVTNATTCGRATQITPADAEYLVHDIGNLSRDETKAATLCGVPGSILAVCEHSLAPPYAVKVLVRANRAGITHAQELRWPEYDLDGSVLFSANWRAGAPNLRQVWRHRAQGIEQVTPDTQDNWDPCVLSNGDVVMKTRDAGRTRLRVVEKGGGSFLLDATQGSESISDGIGLYCGG